MKSSSYTIIFLLKVFKSKRGRIRKKTLNEPFLSHVSVLEGKEFHPLRGCVHQVVGVAAGDVESVTLPGREVVGVDEDTDLPLQHHEHKGVQLGLGESLGGVGSQSDVGSEVVWGSKARLNIKQLTIILY